jgi:hypothetical protein
MPDEWEAFDAIGVAAALARNYAADQKGFMPLLTTFLESAVPEHVQVERKPVKLFSKEKKAVAIDVRLDDWTYRVSDPGGNAPLRCTRAKSVKGITLKTEDVTMAEWLEGIIRLVKQQSGRNERAFFALKDMLDIAG